MTAFSDSDRKKILESLTPDELSTFKEAFTVFDKNQDGTITTKVRFLKLTVTSSIAEHFCVPYTLIVIFTPIELPFIFLLLLQETKVSKLHVRRNFQGTILYIYI